MASSTDVRPKITLACEVCKHRNYITKKNRRNDPDRIELKKFCSNCGTAIDQQATVALPPSEQVAGTPDSVGGYKLLRALGTGGMGTVYEAEEQATGRRVAVKLIRPDLLDSPDAVERFRRELSTILAYVEKLEELEAGSAAEPGKPDQPLRADVIVEWPDVTPLHRAAPDFAGGFFRVPRVIE